MTRDDDPVDTVRVDRWLWSVRVYRSRTASTDACRAGHVRVNDARAKPSTEVRPGDRVSTRHGGRQRILEVVETITTRTSAKDAASAFIDMSPPEPPAPRPLSTSVRDMSSGRPTKRDRRKIDRLRGR